jgi:hypothetical protein
VTTGYINLHAGDAHLWGRTTISGAPNQQSFSSHASLIALSGHFVEGNLTLSVENGAATVSVSLAAPSPQSITLDATRSAKTIEQSQYGCSSGAVILQTSLIVELPYLGQTQILERHRSDQIGGSIETCVGL